MSKLSTSHLHRILLTSILMASSSFAAALGLGNIDVQSGLGEPLRAVIKLEGETKSLESACFRLLYSSDQHPASELRAQITLREDGLGNSNLLIKSQQILNDPIVRLTLTADCENQISREYVLLLDPPLFDNNASQTNLNTFDANAQSPLIESIDQALVKPLASKELGDTIPPPSSKPKKKPVVKTHIFQEKDVGANPARSGSVDSGDARLVLSGGEGDYIRSDFIESPLKLQMAFDLKDWPVNDTDALNDEEISDEVTAMANRLAYLETQMTALQQRNRELEGLRLKGGKLQSESNDQNWATLLVYAFVTLVVIGFIGVAEWLRRRSSLRQINTEVAIWEVLTPTEHLSKGDSDEIMFSSADPEIEMTSSTQAKHNHAKPTPLPQQATQPDSKLFDEGIGATVNEDILEQAEVFVAHGRSNLAIVLLQDYLDEFPSSSPAPWLMLIDLLQKDGLAKEFEAAAIECKRYFNVAAGDFQLPSYKDQSSIEDYPQVKTELEQLWGTPEAIPFLDGLIFNRRLDDMIFNRKIEARTGFKRGAYNDVLFLRSIASEISLIDHSGSLSPPQTRSEEHIFEKTIVLSSPVAHDTTLENVFSEEPPLSEVVVEDWPDSTQLPEDKSTPLDFEFEFPSKRD